MCNLKQTTCVQFLRLYKCEMMLICVLFIPFLLFRLLNEMNSVSQGSFNMLIWSYKQFVGFILSHMTFFFCCFSLFCLKLLSWKNCNLLLTTHFILNCKCDLGLTVFSACQQPYSWLWPNWICNSWQTAHAIQSYQAHNWKKPCTWLTDMITT